MGAFSLASAQSEIPNLVGVWKVKGEGAIMVRTDDGSKQSSVKYDFKSLDAKNVIEKQKGRSIYGYFKSPDKTEELVGVIGSDNRTIYWTGRYGYGQGVIVSPGKIEMIYRQIKEKGGQAWVETLIKQD
jgi:hypothetical protein